VGGRVPPRPDALDAAVNALRLALLEPASEQLDAAIDARPAHVGTTKARGRLLLETAIAHPDDDAALDAAYTAIDDASAAQHASGLFSALDWHAVVLERSAEIIASREDPAARDVLRREALALWQRAADRAPHHTRPMVSIMDLARELGDLALARQAAAEALRRDDNTRLDPLAGLTDAERTRAERLARPDRP